jgi:hypothetical protein
MDAHARDSFFARYYNAWSSECVREAAFLVSRVDSEEKLMHRERSGWETWFVFITCKEHKRMNPNMVLVQDLSQASSSINMLKVGVRIFSSLTSSSGEKKFEAKKKVEKQVAQKSPDLRAPTIRPLPFDFDSIDDQCFSDQMCEQQYTRVPMISGCQ